MNTPPPPPLYPFYSPPGSHYTIHTPDSEGSFDRYSGTHSSGRHSTASINRPQPQRPKIETRQPSYPVPGGYRDRPVFSPTNSSTTMSSTANRDLLYFVYKKNGARWDEDPVVDEIPAPQVQIRKKADLGSKKGAAIQQLEKMGPNRRTQIERHIQILNISETDGSTWEPIYIDNTKTKRRGTVMEVNAFEIIFERKQPKVKRYGMGPAPVPVQPPKPQPQDEKSKKEKRKSRDIKAEKPPMMRGALIDDPFGETQWFDMTGAATGRQGPGNSGATDLPPFIPPEKPIGTLQPRIIAGLDPETDEIFRAMHSMPGAFDHDPTGDGMSTVRPNLARRLAQGIDDDIVAIDDDDDHGHSGRQGRHRRRQSNLARSTSARRRSQRQRSKSRSRNVRFSDQFEPGFVIPPSSNSSMASEDVGVLFDEAEELSSRTSEETSGSPAGPKIYRPVGTAYRQHRPGPSQPSSSRHYELVGKERVPMPSRSRRRPSQAIGDAALQSLYGAEQPLTKRTPSPHQILTAPHRKPLIRTTSEQPQVQHAYNVDPMTRRKSSVRYKTTVHQQTPPPGDSETIPPIAVYPQYFEEREEREKQAERERESTHEQDAHNYMRDTIRQRTFREQEEELARREQALRDKERKALRDEEERQRELLRLRDQLESSRLTSELGQRRSVYSHEPRDFYKGRK